MKVKTILVTQPKPESEKSPYYNITGKFNVKLDFRPFIHIEGVSVHDFRKTRINIPSFSSIILTSRHAADNFFRIAKEMRVTRLDEFKYFCMSESTAYYLQKFMQYRKRKVFIGRQTIDDLIDVIKKHSKDKFLLPCSDIHKQEIPDTLARHGIEFTKAVIYRTVCSDLSDLENVNYDMLVFFSPSGITSLFKNFPKFRQGNTRIAAFGQTTSQAVLDAGLRLDVQAPVPEAPSMTMAIEQYLKKVNK
ncbi:MAG: uroporphyrinogen-III synthase [Bacteroidia bacterium]|nr:uroporphyrinogen-III synthase [Bacteroidia bacterium]MCZ2278131.1 uroporphyrinogen-III synthase [Bacteroidia bacterium]